MRRVLASTAIVAALAGCGSTATHKQVAATTSPAMLTTLQACQQLRADQVANGGTPDVPTLQRLIKRLPPTGQLAADLSTTANDTQASGDNSMSISFDLARLAYDCRKVGVQIPD